MSEIRIKRGEAKTLAFLIKRSGLALDMSGMNPKFQWAVKDEIDDLSYLINKTSGEFDVGDIANGYAKIVLSDIDTDIEEGNYVSELKTVLTSGEDVDKSTMIDFIIEKSVIHD